MMTFVSGEAERPSWTFLTNHAHVLIALKRDPELRQRDISSLVGITPAAVQRILDDLEEGGYLRRERIGRRNRYEILPGSFLRHPLESDHTVDEILDVLAD
jgi:DNA-binding MarR family transcriptional regulator